MVADPSAAGPTSRPSLRSRLLARLLPPLLALFTLSGAVSYFGARHYANSVYDGWLQDSAEALALRVTARGGQPVLDLPEAARQIVQWDATDTTWFEIQGDRRGHIAGQLGLPRHPADFTEPGTSRLYDGKMGGASVRVASITLVPSGSDETVQILVAETLRKRDALAAELLLSILLPEVALVIVAVGVVSWTLRRMLWPVGRVAEALEAQTYYSLEPVDDRDLPGEVVPLTHAMNALLARLKEALSAQRHFIADAAHQLRTPLTALKLHTDEAAHETDPSRLRPLIAELQRAADRAVRLSNQLLTLARAEPSARPPDQSRFDLRPTVVDAASRWVPAALANGVDLGLASADGAPIEVRGNPALMAEAVHNLLDNALKYGRPHGRITVSVIADPAAGRARVTVTDDGPGIESHERGRVLERFHRIDRPQVIDVDGQPRGEQPTGSGLGLAIVAEIARGHGGEIRIDDPPEGPGLCVTIELPLAEPP